MLLHAYALHKGRLPLPAGLQPSLLSCTLLAGLAGMLCHLHWTDPCNLALASLLRSGALDKICRQARQLPNGRAACQLGQQAGRPARGMLLAAADMMMILPQRCRPSSCCPA